jgi:rhodanese-related sulfurtransferase
MATLKTDGAFFAGGVVVGSLLFGPLVAIPAVWNFWNNSGFLGRLTWADVLGVDAGWIVLAVLIMAFGAFAFAEICERIFSRPSERPPALTAKAHLLRRGGVGLAIGMALVAIALGQPTIDRRVAWRSQELDKKLASRKVHIDPGELLSLMYNNQIRLVLLDVRDESDFNRFHLIDAHHLSPDAIAKGQPQEINPKAVYVLMSNDEAQAEQAWKRLAVRRGANAYVLAGGINRWLDLFADHKANVPGPDSPASGDGTLRHPFDVAIGGRHTASRPSSEHITERPFESKVEVLTPVRAPGGGCG